MRLSFFDFFPMDVSTYTHIWRLEIYIGGNIIRNAFIRRDFGKASAGPSLGGALAGRLVRATKNLVIKTETKVLLVKCMSISVCFQDVKFKYAQET